MADPLSIAASIAGIVQLSGTVFKLLIKFSKEAIDAPSKVRELADQARNLAGILENLKLLASSLDVENPKCSFKAQHLNSCRHTLLTIEKKLQKAQDDFESGKKLKAVLRRLKWPFTSSETKELKSALSEHCNTLQLALSADSMDALLKCLAKQDELHKMIEKRFNIDNRIELNRRREKVIEFFLVVNPQNNFEMSQKLRHPMTGLWLTESDETFQKWKVDPNAKLWLSGIPGSGKTVLCGSVIEEVLQESDKFTAISYAFCDYKDTKTHQPENIIAALAVQLGQQKEEAFGLLEEYYGDLKSESQLPRQPGRAELLKLIEKMASMYNKVFLVVDGLDECGDNVEDMTQMLNSLADTSGNISIALFSRKEEDIREELEADYKHIEIEAHTEDLKAYTLDEVRKRKSLRKLELTNPDLYEEIIRTLIQGARGMFRWVACQIDHISDLPNNKARKLALKQLPPTLFGTYDRVLDKLRKCPPETQACVRKALHWTALGIDKLHIRALCEAVSIQDDVDEIDKDDFIDDDEIFRRCGCLLRKSLDNQYFEFSHFTVMEYLQSSSSESLVGEFRYTKEEASRSFTNTSLRFLTFRCFDRKLTTVARKEHAHSVEMFQGHPFYHIAAMVFEPFCAPSLIARPWTLIGVDEIALTWCKKLFDLNKTGCFKVWCLEWMAQSLDGDPQDSYEPSGRFASVLRSTLNSSTTPLHFAARFGLPKLCDFLLQQGANVNLHGLMGTPLHNVLLSSLDYLLFFSSSIDDSQTNKYLSRFANVLEILLDHGADTAFQINKTDSFFVLDFQGLEDHVGEIDNIDALALAFRIVGLTPHSLPLIRPFIRPTTAVSADAIKEFASLPEDSLGDSELQAILDISTSNDARLQWRLLASPALMHAKRRSQLCPDYQKDEFLDNLNDGDYQEALEIAIEDGIIEEVSALIARPRFRSDNGDISRHTLHQAARSRASDVGQIMALLLDSGLAPNNLKNGIQECLEISCALGNTQVVQILLDRGADISHRNSMGETAWHVVASEGNLEILKILFDTDPNVVGSLSTPSKDGLTPISCAIVSGRLEASLLLLSWCPADLVFFQSRDLLLHSAAKIGSQELFSGLLAKGVDLPIQGPDGSTPLHHLGGSCTLAFARYLTEIFDPRRLDYLFRSPFELFFERFLNASLDSDDDESDDDESDDDEFDDEESDDNESEGVWPKEAEILDLMLPPDFTFSSESKEEKHWHVWELICTVAGRNQICSCEAVTSDERTKTRCDRRFLFAFRAILHRGALSSYENSRNQPGITCLLIALSRRPDDWLLCSSSITSLVVSVMESSVFPPSLRHNDGAYEFMKRVITTRSQRLTTTMLQYDLNVHGNESEDWDSVQVPSPLEVACSKADMTTFEIVLAAADPSRLNDNQSSSYNLIDLVINESSESQEEKLRALCKKGVHIRGGDDPTIVAVAAKEMWDLFKCLVSLRADPFAKAKNGWTALHFAAREGDLGMIKWMEKSTSVFPPWESTCMVGKKECEEDDIGLLHLAAYNGYINMIAYLVDEKLLDVNVTTKKGKTPLHQAASAGELRTCEFLLGHGAKLDLRANNGELAIDLALKDSHLEVAQMLLKAGSPLPVEMSDETIRNFPDGSHMPSSSTNFDQMRNLHFEKAILNGNFPACKNAVSQGCTANQLLPSCRSCTPLFAAIRTRKEDLVEWLLEEGATPTGVACQHNADFEVPQHAARFLSSPSCLNKVLSICLEHRICWYPSPYSPIHVAVQEGKDDVLKTILTHIKDNIETYRDVFGPCLEADSRTLSDRKILSLLVDQPSEPEYWETPLHRAARDGNLKALRTLIDYGGNLDVLDAYQGTPFMDAACSNHVDIAKELLTHGAAAELISSDYSAMARAVKRGHLETVKLLGTKSPFSLGFTTANGDNLVHLATEAKSPLETFKYLVSRGVDLFHRNREGICGLDMAINTHAHDLLVYLIQSKLISKVSLGPYNPFAKVCYINRVGQLKTIYKCLPRATSQVLLNLETRWASPLCVAATLNSTQSTTLLLDLQAKIDQVGSAHGTPLMCAVTCGQLDTVKLLVRRGAKLMYTDENGTYKSAFLASLPHPKITAWLLVGRYQDQKKLANRPRWESAKVESPSGKRMVKVGLKAWEQRRWKESTLDYCIRRWKIREGLMGRRIFGELM